jgi:hypothetical protein
MASSKVDHRVWEKALALKCVITYLINERPLLADGKTRPHEKYIEERFPSKRITTMKSLKEKETNDYKIFKRVSVGDDSLEATFESVRRKIRDIIVAGKVELPDVYKTLAIRAGLELPIDDMARPIAIPPFLNIEELMKFCRDQVEIEALVKTYAGCWRTYRLSSRPLEHSGRDRIPEQPLSKIAPQPDQEINIGLLNVKPLSILENEKRLLPQYSFRQMSKDDAIKKEWRRIRTIYGVMMKNSARITLFGERRDTGSSWPFLGMFTWEDHFVGGEGHEQIIENGVSSIPNSEGSKMIGAYFVAEFIPGSDQLDDNSYEELKVRERENYGVRSWREIEKKIKNERAREAIEKMISNSHSDVVVIG